MSTACIPLRHCDRFLCPGCNRNIKPHRHRLEQDLPGTNGGAPTGCSTTCTTDNKIRADFNGDGKPDIIWRDPTTGETYLLAMNGSTFTDSSFVTSVQLTWGIVGK